MYPKVDIPKKEPTQVWYDQAFAPLRHYLERHYPEEAERMIAYLMFMGNEDGRFYYKNSITRASIVFDQSGELVSLIESALEHRFEWLQSSPVSRPPREERFLHPNVERWIAQHLKGNEDAKYGEDIRIFMQEIWGPAVNFDFSDLKAKYPLHGTRPPYCLYVYPSQFHKRIAFQFIGDEIVERKCTHKQYKDFMYGENEMMIAGWRTISIIREMLDAKMPSLVDRMIEIAESRNPV